MYKESGGITLPDSLFFDNFYRFHRCLLSTIILQFMALKVKAVEKKAKEKDRLNQIFCIFAAEKKKLCPS
jgi:hypothetical protein